MLCQCKIDAGPANQHDGTVNRVSQNYWGVRFIGDYVSKRIDRAPASTGESELSRTFDDGTTASNRYVFLTNAQFSVVATADHTGGLVERVIPALPPVLRVRRGSRRCLWIGPVVTIGL